MQIVFLARKPAMDTLDLKMVIIDEENSCRFEIQRKETLIHTLPVWLGKIAEVVFLLNYSIHHHAGIGRNTSSWW